MSNGTVTVTATAKDGTGTTGTFSVIITNQVDAITGIDEVEKLVLYPNPANHGVFTVKGLEVFEKMEIKDIHGNVINSFELGNLNSVEIQMINQSKGVYIVQLFDGSDFTFRKIIIN